MFAPFSLEIYLNYKVSIEIQGLSNTDCNFQGLSRPWIFIFKFKNFQAACEPCNVHFYTTNSYSWSLPQFLNLFLWPTRWTVSADPKDVGLGGGCWLYINVGKEKANIKNNREKTGREKRRGGASLLSSVCFCLFACTPWVVNRPTNCFLTQRNKRKINTHKCKFSNY